MPGYRIHHMVIGQRAAAQVGTVIRPPGEGPCTGTITSSCTGCTQGAPPKQQVLLHVVSRVTAAGDAPQPLTPLGVVGYALHEQEVVPLLHSTEGGGMYIACVYLPTPVHRVQSSSR